MTLAVAAPLLCLLALVMALVEIEIEGPYGWAEKLPTPYRVSGPLARLFGLVLGGKPLTGYNLLMFAATLVAFHLPFAFGAPWTAARELTLLAAWIAWSAVWDFLWFLLNPAYGWRRFRPGNVWWHSRWLWRLPLDYWIAAGASLALALVAQLVVRGEAGAGRRLAVARTRWRRRRCCSPPSSSGRCSPACSRRPTAGSTRARTRAGFDERGRVPITPPPGETSQPERPPRRMRPGRALRGCRLSRSGGRRRGGCCPTLSAIRMLSPFRGTGRGLDSFRRGL